jgi:hypothetical protein
LNESLLNNNDWAASHMVRGHLTQQDQELHHRHLLLLLLLLLSLDLQLSATGWL